MLFWYTLSTLDSRVCIDSMGGTELYCAFGNNSIMVFFRLKNCHYLLHNELYSGIESMGRVSKSSCVYRIYPELLLKLS